MSRRVDDMSGRALTPLAIAAGLSALLAAATVGIVLAPDLRLQVEAPNLRPALEAAGAVAAGLTAGVAYVRFVIGTERVWLYVSAAFLVIAVNRLVVGVAVPPDRIDPEVASYLWTAARFEMGVLLLLGALAARRGGSEASPRPLYGAVVLASLTVLAALGFVVWYWRDALPALSSGTSVPETFTGVQPGLTATDVALGSAGASLFAVAAVLYARDPSLERRNRTWLACVLVLAAFSHIHYMLVPTAFSDRVSTADALRLAMSIVLLLALFDEIRRTYARERERGRELEAAYELERLRAEDLEGLARTKADLLRLLSHELLHPVAAIRTLATSLSVGERKLDDAAKRTAVHAILEQSEQLRDLVERAPYLDELRLRVDPGLADLRVDELVERVQHMFAYLGERFRVEVEPRAAAATVRVDPARLMQVFQNLVSNAEKFSPPGSDVDVVARSRPREVVFEVRDRGRGIARDDVEPSFDPFVRLPNAAGTAGSGLGLFIVRSIVEAHGGTVWIDGAPPGRNVVAFALPRVAEEAP